MADGPDGPSYWAESGRPWSLGNPDLPKYEPVADVNVYVSGRLVGVSMCLGCGSLVPAVTREVHDAHHLTLAELLRGKGSG